MSRRSVEQTLADKQETHHLNQENSRMNEKDGQSQIRTVRYPGSTNQAAQRLFTSAQNTVIQNQNLLPIIKPK